MKKPIAAFVFAALLAGGLTGCSRENKPPQAESTEETSAVETVEEQPATAESSQALSHEQESGTTRRTSITLVTTRATSPSRLTERPTTEMRTTVVYTTPTRTRRTTIERTTAPTRVPATTTEKETIVEPSIEYGGEISYDAGGITDVVKIIEHSCELSETGSIAVTLTTQTVSASGDRRSIYIGYNCYDASGRLLNPQVLACVVPVSEAGGQAKTVITAPRTTARIEFVKYS